MSYKMVARWEGGWLFHEMSVGHAVNLTAKVPKVKREWK